MKIKWTTLLRAIRLYLVIAGGLLVPVATQAAEAKKLGDLRGVHQADFNHDGSRVIVHPRNESVGIWEVSTGKRLTGDLKPNTAFERYLISADAKMVLVGFKEGGSRMFDAATAKAISPMLDVPLLGSFQAPGVFSPTGDTILIFAEKKAVVFSIRSGKRIATIPLEPGPDAQEPGSAAFTAGGAHCLLMDGGGTVTRYDTRDWKPIGKPMKHPPADLAYNFAFNASDDGKWLVTFDNPGENGPDAHLQVWDAAANTPIGEPVVARNGFIGRILGGNRVLILSGSGEATVRDLPSMTLAYTLRSHSNSYEPSVDVSPDSKWILAWGPDRVLDLVDAASGKLATYHNSSAMVKKVMMAPDSSACYVVYDNSAFEDQKHYDYYLIKMTFPELKITDSLRTLDSSLSSSLSPDGKRLLILQGKDEQERILFVDPANLKPLK